MTVQICTRSIEEVANQAGALPVSYTCQLPEGHNGRHRADVDPADHEGLMHITWVHDLSKPVIRTWADGTQTSD